MDRKVIDMSSKRKAAGALTNASKPMKPSPSVEALRASDLQGANPKKRKKAEVTSDRPSSKRIKTSNEPLADQDRSVQGEPITGSAHLYRPDQLLEFELVQAPAASPQSEATSQARLRGGVAGQSIPRIIGTKQFKKVRFAPNEEKELLEENLRWNMVRYKRRKLLQSEGVVAFHTRLGGKWWEESDSKNTSEPDWGSDDD